MSEISTVIYKYQTLIVGMLGFAGVVATLFTNAYLNRRQRYNEIKHKQDSVRQGLVTELRSVRDTYLDRSNGVETEKDWLIPERVTDYFYQAMLPELGILTQKELALVLKAYLLISEMPTRLLLISPVSRTDQPRDGYIQISNEHISHVKKMHKAFVPEMEAAISELESHLPNGGEE